MCYSAQIKADYGRFVRTFGARIGGIPELIDDGESYEMFSKGDTAWVDTGNDKKIVAAMKSGKSLVVNGTSWRGTQTEDTYSLVGISAALAAIDKACK